MQTTRREIADHLRRTDATPSELAATFEISNATALDHIEHLATSLSSTDERVVVRPPRCRDCDFDNFDDLVNIPSRCPSCRAENIAEPMIRIE